ncbi:hypothetical protein [Subtercola lobariae]|nr:hypothetical protein [Subtercola lobariae]
MAREFIASTLEISVDEVGVHVEVDAVGEVHGIVKTLDAIRAERLRAEALERDATNAASDLAKRLVQQNVPLRDIGTVLGVSHQRAHQLVSR